MKKYIPEKMIIQSRFVTYYESWNKKEQLKLQEKITSLIKENSEYCDNKNYGHLCNLLTSLGMILVLEENGETRENAENLVASAMYKYIVPQKQSMKKLASFGFFVSFLKMTMPTKYRLTLGYGWDVEIPKCSRDTFALTTHECIYKKIFTKYEMPEMTAVFCKVDDILYSELPRAEFSYTEQIGTGGKVCDYSFRKR